VECSRRVVPRPPPPGGSVARRACILGRNGSDPWDRLDSTRVMSAGSEEKILGKGKASGLVIDDVILPGCGVPRYRGGAGLGQVAPPPQDSRERFRQAIRRPEPPLPCHR